MLLGFLEKAVTMGCDSIEIEYKDHKEWVTAFSGPVGCGIGCLDSGEAKFVFKELDELKKANRAVLCGTVYKLAFSRYESFGEWVHRIQLRADRQMTTNDRPSRRAGATRCIPLV
jgi:hypothetical protein